MLNPWMMKANFEYLIIPPETSIHAFVKQQQDTHTPFHYHPEYEINLVIHSDGTRYVGNRIDHFEEGDLTLLAPNVPHCWKNNEKNHYPYSSLVIQWRASLLEKLFSEAPEFAPARRLLTLSSKGLVFDKYAGNEIRGIHRELTQGTPFDKLILFLKLLNDLAKSKEYKTLGNDELISGENDSRIYTVYNFVKENYSDKITLNQVASLVHMSEGAFSRFFSQSNKKPFFTFLNEFRISMACTMLRETEMQASEIGYACGYDCLQFFYRQFARYIHCTPKEYRSRINMA